MSAESPRSRSQTAGSNGSATVTPQNVTDPTILDSVAGFINDVVPTTYNVPCDTKDQIQWAHFEQLDCDETTFAPNFDCDKVVPPPLILILGYTTGIQIWAIPANGEATEILSWRHGSVRMLRLLPTPAVVGSSPSVDLFASKRPLIALCDAATPGSQYCSLGFISLRTGEQVKMIKFKNPILNVLANKRSVVVTFAERIAIFDAFTLEDRLTVTTCYLSPGLQPNPVSLGTRWLAYAEKKLNLPKRSSGGNEGEGIQSYTATVLHAAKSLGRGLRELGETVASSLTGNTNYKPGTSPNSPQAGGQSDVPQKGVVTVLDIESSNVNSMEKSIQPEAIIAHFTAHTEAIVCLQFDPSGMLLLTADKRGHDFHLFRIHPHPCGSSLAAVHHLYVLHRGDTSARVQDMCFSPDSRWVTVSTLRGTTHVFPITPYGGNVGVRTHATPHVVNKMSRFHRSAGLTAEGRSNSPVTMFETPISSHFPYQNPRFPPFPHPTIVQPLAQIRQPVYLQNMSNQPPRQAVPGRQRVSSSSEENIALRVVATFAAPRAWIDPLPVNRDGPYIKPQAKPVESLFIMSCHGTLVQYDLDPHQAASVPKEKVCDDSPIELTVCAKAQWQLQRQPHSVDVALPVAADHLNFIAQEGVPGQIHNNKKLDDNDDHWLSQVEIVTHAGPHRRLWMGPQFTFKTYTTVNGSPMSVAETQALDLGRSKPVNMPITKANAILIESGSASSCEQSLLDTYHKTCDEVGGIGELQLKEDLADAMLESPGIKETGGRCVIVSVKQPTQPPVVAKVVNPLGTVVTVQSDEEVEMDLPEEIIHENCDEALFRPVIPSKNVLYAEIKPKFEVANDEIITKSLESTTEVVAVKILEKDDENRDNGRKKNSSKSRNLSPKNMKNNRSKESPPKQNVNKKEAESESKKQNKSKEKAKKEVEIDGLESKTNKDGKANKDDLANKDSKLKVEEKLRKSEEKISKNDLQLNKIEQEKLEEKPKKIEQFNKIKSIELEKEINKCEKESKSDSRFNKIEDKPNPNFEYKSKEKQKSKLSEKQGKQEKQEKQEKLETSEPKSDEPIFDCDFPDPFNDIPDLSSAHVEFTFNLKKQINKLEMKDDFKFEIPPLDNDDFFSLENLAKADHFEDARDCYENVPNDFLITTCNFPELDLVEEKSLTKKPRKPKPKLGVKIAAKDSGVEKSKSEREKSVVEDEIVDFEGEITWTAPKKSWSSIAATTKPKINVSQPNKIEKVEKPEKVEKVEKVEKLLIDAEEKDPQQFELPLIETADHFSAEIDNKYSSCVVNNLIDINTPPETENIIYSNIESKIEEASEDLNLLKISDDEKLDTGSSPTETTTESDDSSKVPPVVAVEEVEGGPALIMSSNPPQSKSAKKKMKKKRKPN